ncbi:hypothetical protein [Paraclostridium dentum]|uniref:hypothetical protein n=1 Tax=Paraclostridium dentum TaxID=2662455 RepID=UPI003F2CEBFC
MQGIQAVDVYPIKRNGRPLVAGMNGNKGSIAMYPVKEGYDSLQGMVLKTIETIETKLGGDNKFFK